ncbi:hypothetical protein BSNK01_01620 [Bacillaceae bacterium]
MIRDFSWTYFTVTGDIHAYLLFKEQEKYGRQNSLENLDAADAKEQKEA